jgi:hypothetical protein
VNYIEPATAREENRPHRLGPRNGADVGRDARPVPNKRASQPVRVEAVSEAVSSSYRLDRTRRRPADIRNVNYIEPATAREENRPHRLGPRNGADVGRDARP